MCLFEWIHHLSSLCWVQPPIDRMLSVFTMRVSRKLNMPLIFYQLIAKCTEGKRRKVWTPTFRNKLSDNYLKRQSWNNVKNKKMSIILLFPWVSAKKSSMKLERNLLKLNRRKCVGVRIWKREMYTLLFMMGQMKWYSLKKNGDFNVKTFLLCELWFF